MMGMFSQAGEGDQAILAKGSDPTIIGLNKVSDKQPLSPRIFSLTV
jgi:hypothetical protein